MSIIVPGVVLCAGRSSRMGRPKALLPTSESGETFIGRIVRVLREGGVDDVVVVVAPDVPPLDAAFAHMDQPPRAVHNPSPDHGQLSSLLVGLRAVDRPGVGGVLVTLVDVPLIDAETVSRLRKVHQQTRAPVVRPVQNERHGHPVIFDRAVFDELRNADPRTGAKTVVRAHLNDAAEVKVDVDGPFLDIDTPSEYARVFDRELPPVSTRTRG